MDIKKLLFLWVLLLFGLNGCATSYNSLKDSENGRMQIILAPEPDVLSAAYEAISSEFPSASIEEIKSYQSGYSWFHMPLLDRTNFRFLVKEISGITYDGDDVHGYTVDITTSGTQGFVNSRYVKPVIKKFNSVLAERKIHKRYIAKLTYSKKSSPRNIGTPDLNSISSTPNLQNRNSVAVKGDTPIIDWVFSPAVHDKDTVIVIFGNRNYSKGVPLVHYAHNDAKAMKRFAIDSLGLQPEDIIYEEDATKGVMEGIFQSILPSRVKSGKRNILIYFSGHGIAANNDAKLLPVDSRPNTAEITGYSRNELLKQLNDLKVNSVVILDACFTGTGKNGAALLAGKPVFKAPNQARVPSNVTLISATSSNQIAWMDDKTGHSLMTYYFLKGLQGDADENGNKVINTHELASYLTISVNRASLIQNNQEQRPEIIGQDRILLKRN